MRIPTMSRACSLRALASLVAIVLLPAPFIAPTAGAQAPAATNGAATPTDAPSPAAAATNGTKAAPFISIARLQGGSQLGLDLNLIQPGSFFFVDTGDDEPGEVDVFNDGKLAVAVQLAGLDLGWRPASNALRFGVNGGVAMTSATVTAFCRTRSTTGDCTQQVAAQSGPAMIFGGGVFLQVRDLMRFETGFMRGRSGLETLSRAQGTDTGRYVGLSLNTKLGDLLESVIR